MFKQGPPVVPSTPLTFTVLAGNKMKRQLDKDICFINEEYLVMNHFSLSVSQRVF